MTLNYFNLGFSLILYNKLSKKIKNFFRVSLFTSTLQEVTIYIYSKYVLTN